MHYSDTVIGTLAVGVWAVTFGTAKTGLGELQLQSLPRCTKCNSPHINGQCIPTLYYSMWHYITFAL